MMLDISVVTASTTEVKWYVVHELMKISPYWHLWERGETIIFLESIIYNGSFMCYVT